MDLKEVGCGGIDWIGLAGVRNSCRKIVQACFEIHPVHISSLF
jgi:hypothetical protein